MKKIYLPLVLLFFANNVFAQVGVNTTLPHAQLDVRSTSQATPANNDGMLVPKVDSFPATNPTALQQSMLVYLTTSTTFLATTRQPGFYYWNNPTSDWIALTPAPTSDHDWYEEGTTTAPDAITDDMYHMGNVAIGRNVASYPLDIEATTAHRGISNLLNNSTSGADKIGIDNTISGTANDINYGLKTSILNIGTGTHYAQHNTLTGGGTGSQYGSWTEITNTGSGAHIGAEYTLSGGGTGARYGISTSISNATGSDHYGIVSRLNGGGTGTRWGTYNTIGGAGTGQQTAVYNQLNGSGTGINHGVFSQLSGSGVSQKYGIRNELTGEGAQFGGFFLLGGSGTGVQTGLTNEISNSSNSSHYGTVNSLSGTGSGTKMGMYSILAPGAGGTHYGVYSEVLKPGANNYAGYFLGNVGIGTTIGNTYTLPPSRGANNQIMLTNGTGVVTWQNASAIQDHDWYEVGGTTAPDAITDNMYHTGFVAIGKNVANYALDVTSTGRTINSTSTSGGFAAIYGVNSTATAAGSGGHGVFGQTSQTASSGVRGEQLGTAGNGVVAVNFGASGAGTGTGVFAQTSQSQGFAASAYNINASGTGLFGSGNNIGGMYLVAGSGGAFNGLATGIFARSTTAGISTAVYSENFGVPNRVNYWDGGTMYKILGTGTVSTTAEAPNGERVVLHCTEAPEIYFEDYGQGQLVNGRVHIDLDPIIAKNITVNEKHPLRVFIQLEDECNGVFVTNKTGNSFDVVELASGQSNAKFQYRIVGNRADEVLPGGRISRNADVRFEKAPGLESSKQSESNIETIK